MRNRLSRQDFINRSNYIHKYKYNYDLVGFEITTRRIIDILCPIHGKFENLCGTHLSGKSGCPECSKDKLKNDFLGKALKIHKNKYDYSLVEYKNNDTKIKIICPTHGIFEQIPHHHTNGDGCKMCADDSKKLNTETFIKRATCINGDKYDYSLSIFNGSFQKIKIICKEHGIFEQRAGEHINQHKRGCPKCGGTLKSSTEEFILKANKIHKNLYDYSLVDYNTCTDNVSIICKKHGIFKQKPTLHLTGQGCPVCCQSKGEIKIKNFLEENGTNYIYQKRFDDCRDILPLPFDFYLPKFNSCIEYDGEQHFNFKDYYGGKKGLEKIKKHDIIKNKYCNKNNIKLVRISYREDVIKKLEKEYGNTII